MERVGDSVHCWTMGHLLFETKVPHIKVDVWGLTGERVLASIRWIRLELIALSAALFEL